MRLAATTAVRTTPANRPTTEPLGGTSGDLRHRLLRFHLPIAVVSAVVISVWINVPLFRPTGQQMPMNHEMPMPAQAAQPADQQVPIPAAEPGQTSQHLNAMRRGQAAGHQMPAQAGQAPGHEMSMPAQAAGAPAAIEHGSSQLGSPDAMSSLMQYRGLLSRFTTASGYVATGLLVLTLLIGPINLLLRRRNPISTYLRRDVGVWTGIISVVHVIAGFQVHGPPGDLDERILRYFFARDGSLLLDTFGLGNWTGLAATVIVVGLLAISSDFALRKLKFRRWKWLQRMNYLLFALVVAHAIYYAAFGGSLLQASSPSTLLLGPMVVAVFVGQAVGVWLWRRSHVRAPAQRVSAATGAARP
jgi:sulfoxide reductase heme-binding subunit YedZ